MILPPVSKGLPYRSGSLDHRCPTKKSDARSKNFKGESVEVDAIEPEQLRELVRDCIERHVNPVTLAQTQRIEESERETLARVVDQFDGLGA